MGKKKDKKNTQQQPQNNAYFEPQSPPPAAPPPPAPQPQISTIGIGSGGGGETDALMGYAAYGSYQQNEQLRDQMQTNGHAGTPPVVTNFNHNAVYTGFGDISLRPNTGESNWMDDELLGLSLHEIMKTLQWSNILSCAGVIVLEIAIAIFRVFSPTRLVLGVYLAFFASILLRVEISHILRQHREHLRIGDMPSNNEEETSNLVGGGSSSGSNIGTFGRIPNMGVASLRDNFGLVFHPSGKACILFLMASMCIGQHNNLLEDLMGCLFGLNATIIMYLLFQYPAYRRQEDIPIPKLPALPSRATAARAWSYYENDASSLWQVTTTIAEGASMLTPVAGNSNNYYQ